MKNFITVLFILSNVIAFGQSNEFIGVVSGGEYDNGIIYTTDSTGEFKEVVYAFKSIKGKYPSGQFVWVDSTYFYGVTANGGGYNLGVLFRFNPKTGEYELLYNFGEGVKDGANPGAGLMLGSNGKLYGTTRKGGKYNQGSLYVYDYKADTINFFHSFSNNGVSAYDPQGELIETRSGELLVNVYYGGTNKGGAIYEVDTSSLVTTKLIDFNKVNHGFEPLGELIEVDSNIFYGATRAGGPKSKGTIFAYDRSANSITVKMSFEDDKTTGAFPNGGLTKASNGKLYGVTYEYSGDDVLFEYDVPTQSYKKILVFNNITGVDPISKLTEVKPGVLIGTTDKLGRNGVGALFRYNVDEDTVSVLHAFDSDITGDDASFGVAMGPDGKFYGVFQGGDGSLSNGNIFSYDMQNNSFQRELYFGYAEKGIQPSGELVQASNGLLYGNIQIGGDNNYGGIFSYDPATREVELLAQYNDSIGFEMQYSWMEASNGKLYGQCLRGGKHNDGTLIEFDITTNEIKRLVDFDRDETGRISYGNLVEYKGDLYGTKYAGGLNDNGTIFKFNLTSQEFTKIYDFDVNATGNGPVGGLTLVGDKFFGLTFIGGANNEGVLYEFVPATNKVSAKLSFSRNVSGKRPVGTMLLANNGRLYGTTTEGGDHSVGSLFEYYPSTNQLLNKAGFYQGKYSERATGELMQASNGHIYGLTSKGGDNDNGVLFEYKIGTKLITRKYHLSRYETGWYVNGALLELNSCRFTKTILEQPELTARAELVDYQWLNCDKNYEKIEGETGKTFRPASDGNYAVEISSRFCKDTSECVNLTPSGVEDIPTNAIGLYPNPSESYFSIQSSTLIGNAEIRVINPLGKMVYQQAINELSKSTIIHHDLPSGVYLVQVVRRNSVFTDKLVVE